MFVHTLCLPTIPTLNVNEYTKSVYKYVRSDVFGQMHVAVRPVRNICQLEQISKAMEFHWKYENVFMSPYKFIVKNNRIHALNAIIFERHC